MRWRDRWRNLLAGFGPVSISRREANTIDLLELNGHPAPKILAFGWVEKRAFLLVEEVKGAIPLRCLLEIRKAIAKDLGRKLASIHDFGVDQPDLFAKHILVNPITKRIVIIDWQRARQRRKVDSSKRVEALATFQATAFDDPAAPPDWWQQMLDGYFEKRNFPEGVRELVTNEIDRRASIIRHRPNIRAQRLEKAGVEQLLIRINGETVCAIPEVAEHLDSHEAIQSLYNLDNDGQTLKPNEKITGLLRTRRYRSPLGHFFAAIRGRSWRSPELRAARLLFHLEKYGIPAPRLFAYGQRLPFWRPATAFLLSENLPADPIDATDPNHRAQTFDLLKRLHDSGCVLVDFGPDGSPFGVRDRQVVVANGSKLRLCKRISDRTAQRDFDRLTAFFGAAR